MMRKFCENDETLTGVISTVVRKEKKDTNDDDQGSGNYDNYDDCCKEFFQTGDAVQLWISQNENRYFLVFSVFIENVTIFH